jgi:type VI secretion system protein ImpJ
MSLNNKVVWSEGIFLRPHHFQQQERYLESLVERRAWPLLSYAYGFSEIQLDQELLKLGKVGLARVAGLMPDGTPFDVPVDAPIPAPLDVPKDCKDAVIALTLPLRRPGMPETGLAESDDTLLRYRAADQDARDANREHDRSATLRVGQLNLRIQIADEATSAVMKMGIARVREVRADGMVVLDDSFIAPCVDCRASRRLTDWIKEIHGLLVHRGRALAGRLAQPGAKGVAEFSDFLFLMACNRAEPVLAHLARRAVVHPEAFYLEALRVAGELATFGRDERRPREFEAYRHDELERVFPPVIEEIRRALTTVLDQTAIALQVVDRGRGVFVAEIPDVQLLRNASFVLAVGADVPTEVLRVNFPTQVKIGPVEKIRDLVMSHLPGIVVQPMPVAPRQIPYHAGYNYFELDRRSEFWKGVEVSRVLALHVAGDFQGLTLEMWAIRDAS